MAITRDTIQSWISTLHGILYNIRGPNCTCYHCQCGLNYHEMTKRERINEWEHESAKYMFLGVSCTPRSCECEATHYDLMYEEIHDIERESSYVGIEDEWIHEVIVMECHYVGWLYWITIRLLIEYFVFVKELIILYCLYLVSFSVSIFRLISRASIVCFIVQIVLLFVIITTIIH